MPYLLRINWFSKSLESFILGQAVGDVTQEGAEFTQGFLLLFMLCVYDFGLLLVFILPLLFIVVFIFLISRVRGGFLLGDDSVAPSAFSSPLFSDSWGDESMKVWQVMQIQAGLCIYLRSVCYANYKN